MWRLVEAGILIGCKRNVYRASDMRPIRWVLFSSNDDSDDMFSAIGCRAIGIESLMEVGRERDGEPLAVGR